MTKAKVLTIVKSKGYWKMAVVKDIESGAIRTVLISSPHKVGDIVIC